jgi:hypothetical protein
MKELAVSVLLYSLVAAVTAVVVFTLWCLR